MAELGVVVLEEADGLDEARGKGGPYAKDLVALVDSTKHLAVHGLEGVFAIDSLLRARVQAEGITTPELLALVVSGQD